MNAAFVFKAVARLPPFLTQLEIIYMYVCIYDVGTLRYALITQENKFHVAQVLHRIPMHSQLIQTHYKPLQARQ